MLVLTRRSGEKVMVGDDVTVTVLEVSSGQVKLGFQAPDEVGVHRLEVWQRIQLGLEAPRRVGRVGRRAGAGEQPDEAAS